MPFQVMGSFAHSFGCLDLLARTSKACLSQAALLCACCTLAWATHQLWRNHISERKCHYGNNIFFGVVTSQQRKDRYSMCALASRSVATGLVSGRFDFSMIANNLLRNRNGNWMFVSQRILRPGLSPRQFFGFHWSRWTSQVYRTTIPI